ncbi:MAG TPA: hypothetical protein VGK58_12250, partial [Lacipirellulaceae bacterium]
QEIFASGGRYEEMRDAVMDGLKARFLPEFLNRVDEIIVFRPLTREEIRKIVDLQTVRLVKLLEQRGYGLEVSERARAEIAARGYDPANGARPLKRVIQNELQNRLATELLRGEFPEGSTIRIDYDGDAFTFEATGGENGAPRRGDKSRGDEILSAEVV